jgi:hypothetical protein
MCDTRFPFCAIFYDLDVSKMDLVRGWQLSVLITMFSRCCVKLEINIEFWIIANDEKILYMKSKMNRSGRSYPEKHNPAKQQRREV